MQEKLEKSDTVHLLWTAAEGGPSLATQYWVVYELYYVLHFCQLFCQAALLEDKLELGP